MILDMGGNFLRDTKSLGQPDIVRSESCQKKNPGSGIRITSISQELCELPNNSSVKRVIYLSV